MNNTILASQPPPMWGERTSLLDKGLKYMFSMDLVLELGANGIAQTKDGLVVAVTAPAGDEGEKGRAFHVLDEVLGRTPDGLVCNVPVGKVTRLNDHIVIDLYGTASLDGRVSLKLESPVSIAYTGVATFAGGADRALAAALPPLKPPVVVAQGAPAAPAPPEPRPAFGSAFISMRTECPLPKYRWMVENQLFGFGRVHVLPVDAGGYTLSFSYDVYAAGAVV